MGRTINNMSQLRNSLEESHKDLYQWFLLHQECLLLHNDDDARLAFLAFTEYLQAHLEFENEYLLNVQVMTGIPLRWPLDVYQKEHAKLDKILAKLAGYLQHYYGLAGREKRLALLAVLDEEQTFRHVMEHHELREEQDLFSHLPDSLALHELWSDMQVRLVDKYAALKERLKLLLEEA
jgi:hypothetical protein